MKRTMTQKLLCLLGAAALSLSMAACSAAPASSSSAAQSSTPATSAAAPSVPASSETTSIDPQSGTVITITDQAGRVVTLAQPAQKIVSGYYISSSACIALGLSDKLVGIEAKADSRPIYKKAAPALLALPNVGTAKEFNLEGCIALEPDLVILPKRLKESAEALSALDIPVILVSPEDHTSLVEMLTLIGKAAGVEEAAAKLISYYDAELAAVSSLVSPLTEKPSVYMAGNSAYLSTAPKSMYQSSLIEAAGGINAAAAIEGDNWTDVSYEQLLAMNPEVIVIPAEASYSKADLTADSQLSELNAVKNNKVYQMPKDFEAWDSPVPSATLGIRWMLSALHPDIYSIEDLQTDASAFYLDFYGIEIDSSLIGM